MNKKRSHRNTQRLTAEERVAWWMRLDTKATKGSEAEFHGLVEALKAHAKETLSRERTRRVRLLSDSTKAAIRNAREKAPGAGCPYLPAVVELAKGLKL